MFKKIFFWWHIFKARIVVGYVFLYSFGACANIKRRLMLQTLGEDILFLICHPVAFCREGLPKKGIQARYKHRLVAEQFKEAYNTLYKDFFREYTAHRKTALADYVYINMKCLSLGSYFPRVIAIAWLCEKLNLNVKFTFSGSRLTHGTNFFETPVLSYAKTCRHEKFEQLNKPLVDMTYRNEGATPSLWEDFGKRKISSEYGRSIISKLTIKREIQQQVDQWCRENMKRKYIGVHYRRTDGLGLSRVIKLEDYIDYLKQVLDDRHIVACSDTAQFIVAISKEFPGRVITRDITRSTDTRSLHRHEPYAGDQQRIDALIDMMILAKTELIYTTGSFYVDAVRFFNPAIKIIALDGRRSIYRGLPNYVPIPHRHLIEKYQRNTSWKSSFMREKEQPLD